MPPAARGGFLELTVSRAWGGAGASTIAYEALGQGCPSTALAFNMHASVAIPVLLSPDGPASEPGGAAAPVDRRQRFRARRDFADRQTAVPRRRKVDGCYSLSGRKMFGSMLQAADQVMVMAYPDGAINPFAASLLMVPHGLAGRRVWRPIPPCVKQCRS